MPSPRGKSPWPRRPVPRMPPTGTRAGSRTRWAERGEAFQLLIGLARSLLARLDGRGDHSSQAVTWFFGGSYDWRGAAGRAMLGEMDRSPLTRIKPLLDCATAFQKIALDCVAKV